VAAHKANSADLLCRCGYFTFVPYAKSTCGTYTRRDTVWDPALPGVKACENPRTFINVCAKQGLEQWAENDDYSGNMKAPRTFLGVMKIVYVDCYTGQKVADSFKDDVLSHDGVMIPDDSPYWKTLTEHWKISKELAEWTTFDDVKCSKRPGDRPVYSRDCVDAISSLRRNADMVFSDTEVTVVAVRDSRSFPLAELTLWKDFARCAIHAQLYKHANVPDCQYTYLEIAIAIDQGRKSCAREFGYCPQFPLYDKGNGCYGWVTVSRDPGDKCGW
jgi:hypothetical protein